MENKFDEKIGKMLKEEVYIPQKITNAIKTSLKEEKRGKGFQMKLSKIVATMIGVVVIGTGAVFAGQAFWASRFQSVMEAKERGYFEKVEGDYVTVAGIGIKISSYFVDIGKVGLTFDIKTEEPFDEIRMYNATEQTQNSSTSDLIKFIDENEKEIPYVFSDEFGIHRGAEFDIGIEQLENNVLRMDYIEYPNEDYHQARKMKVVIKKIVTKKEGKEKEYIGNWEFEIKIADRFLNKQENVTYQATMGGVEIGKAELGATELIVRIDSKEVQKVEESKKEIIKLEPIDGNEIYKFMPRLLDEKGQELQNVFSGMRSSNDSGIEEYKFNISRYSVQNSYKIVLNGGVVITLTK